MQNDKVFGALRATTLAALCAGGLMVALGGCTAESGAPSPADGGGDKPAAEKSCGENSCGESKGGAEKSATEKSCGESSCGEKSSDEKSCGESSCGGDKKK
jgi:uncharacterized low-complexity protein